MRKTKIVCTLGPACDSEETLKRMIVAGLNVARFNFSHGTHEEQKARLDRFIKVRDELGVAAATMLDTKGPEIRLRKFEDGRITLEKGQLFTLKAEDCMGTQELCAISYPELYRDVEVGTTILLDDGLIEMKVEQIEGSDIVCRVQNGGPVSDRKGVNIPNVRFSMPYLSEKDEQDIIFAVENKFDFIAASFVRCADDVMQIRRVLERYGSTIDIISKIENSDGVENIDEILAVSDGIMVARGDMGVEIQFEKLPSIQKELIKKANQQGKVVITATQMLESMIKNPRPTRAEASDVANAVYDGTSAIMLSGETAAGAHPVAAVQTMATIALSAESDINYVHRLRTRGGEVPAGVTNAISYATCTAAASLNAAAIITITKTGRTARMISKFRPNVPVICCTASEEAYRKLCLVWGVTPIVVPEVTNTDELFEHAIAESSNRGFVKQGDMVILTVGLPLGVAGTTNLMKIEVIGDLLASGTGIGNKVITGNVTVCRNESDVLRLTSDGDIIVAPFTTNKMLPAIKKASGLIVEQGGLESHTATIAIALDIPTVMNAQGATQNMKTGMPVVLDAERGTVCSAVKGHG